MAACWLHSSGVVGSEVICVICECAAVGSGVLWSVVGVLSVDEGFVNVNVAVVVLHTQI